MAEMGSFIFRATRDFPYKVTCVHAVESDHDLSWKACGLLWYLISRPEGWQLFRSDLQNRHTDGRDGVLAGLKELKERGYLKILDPRGQKGQFMPSIWVVSELPLSNEKEWKKLLERMGLDDAENVLRLI